MVDKIQTELDIDLKQGNTLADVKEIADKLKIAQENIHGTVLESAELERSFRSVLGTLKQTSTAMAELKALTQGSITSVLNRSALTGVRNETKGSDQSIALALAKDELTVRKQTALMGEKLVENYKVEGKLKQGISDLSTLQYQREIALEKIAKISLGNSENKKKLLGQQATILANLETGLRSLETLEKNRVNYMKQQEAARKKELADAEKAIVLAEKKAAREKERDAKTGVGIVAEINRKSMGELLITQTKLLANYQLINTVLNSFQFAVTYVRELDQAFTELQAIGDLTKTQMMGVKDAIIDVASSSKFSAVEVAQAAITLAQAGYSGDQIRGSIKSITLLAQAAGSDLKTAVDITTSVLNVFNYQVEQTGQIANTLTYALNTSKLSIEQLGLGIQYAANVSADANIAFEEMVASFGVLSNAGIRSGSTIGTGYRQLINDIKAPSEKLRTRLVELGLSLDDISIKSKGLVGVLKTLRDSGFTSADALETLEVRAAATFSAMQQGLDTISAQERAMMLSSAATKASETQMSSLNSIIKQLQGNMGSLAFNMSQGLLKAFSSVFQAINSTVVALQPFASILGTIAAVAVGGILIKLISLERIIMTLIGGFNLFVGAISLVGTAFNVASTAVGVFTTVMKVAFATSLWTGWGLVIAGLGAALYGLYTVYEYFSDRTKTVNDAIEENQTKINESKATLEKYEAQGRQVNNFLKTLRDQHQLLTTDTEAMRTKTLEAKLAFEGLGGTIINLSDDYETLLNKMVQVRIATAQQTAIAAGAAAAAQRVSILSTNQAINANSSNIKRAGDDVNLRGFSKSDQELIKSAIAEGMLDATTRSQSLNGNSDFIGKFTRLTQLASNTKDESQRAQLTALLASLKPSLDGISSNIQAADEIRKNEALVTKSNFDASTAQITASAIQLAGKTIGDANKSLTKATSSKEFDDIKQIYDTAANSLKAGEQLTTKVLGFLGRSVPPDSQNKAEIDALIAEAQRRSREVGAISAKVKGNELEIAIAGVNTDIQRLKTESKVSSLSGKADTERAIADAFAKKLAFELEKNKAEVNAPDFLVKQGLETLTDPTKRDAYLKQQESERNQNSINQLNQQRDKVLQEFNERIGKTNAAVEDGLLPTITALQIKFKGLTDSLELAIKAAESPVKIKEAQISALDVGNNKFNVTDAQRYKAQQELEKLQAQAAGEKLAAYQAQVEPLAQQLADLRLLKADLERQGASAGATASDLAGSSFGNQSGQRLKNLQGQYKTTLTEIEKVNKASEELPINLAQAKAQFDALNTPVAEGSVWQVFSDSLGVYMDQQTKLAKSNAELGRGFTRIFEDINSGFSTVVRNIATGTGSIKSSFQDMARSIISNLLDIAVKRASAGIFDSIFGSVVGAVTGGITGGVTQSAAPIQGLGEIQVTNLAQGGIVRGNLARDSVRTNLMPGEAVLTRSAVSMLGEDTVNSLNQQGNRVASQSAPAAPQAANTNYAPTEQNIYIVDQRSQIPSLGEKDVVMIVSDNINRGGTIKKAVRSAM